MIETERLVLTRWGPAERDGFAAMSADPAVMAWLGGVQDRAGAGARIDRVEAMWEAVGYGRFALRRRDDDAFMGWCGVMPAHPSLPVAGTPEIGWRLVSGAWGHGYATEAALAALEDAFGRAGLPEVIAYTAPHNVRSQAVMHRLGMTRAVERDFDQPDPAPGDPFKRSWVYVARAPA